MGGQIRSGRLLRAIVHALGIEKPSEPDHRPSAKTCDMAVTLESKHAVATRRVGAGSVAHQHALDAARGALMTLGVVLHASNIYCTRCGWLVGDAMRARVFDWVSEAIHVFRMPAFFWIAGYFCGLTYARAGSAGLLRKRLLRLVVPLLAAWLTLNVIQVATHAALLGRPVLPTLGGGIPLFHLWFLVDLIVFTVLAAMLLPALDKHRGDNLVAWPVLLVALAAATYAVNLLSRVAPSGDVLGLTSAQRLATYAPFFAVGLWMYGAPRARQTLTKVPLWLLPVAIVVAMGATVHVKGRSILVAEMAKLVETGAVWLCVAAVMAAFERFFAERSRVALFFSEASYTVYLFHHVLVVTLGLLLAPSAWPAWVKFTLVVVGTVAATSALHFGLVRRVPLLRYLFNGK